VNQAIPGTVIFLGALGLLAYWMWTRQQFAAMTAPSPDAADNWQTPFYLRANTPVFDGSQAILPTVPDDSWSLATFYGG
jgi:hypothetical protein